MAETVSCCDDCPSDHLCCGKPAHIQRFRENITYSDIVLAPYRIVQYGCIVMIFAYAEPDKDWGHWPCEGLTPSTHTCVSDGSVAARRTHPGLGAAWKGSNVADRHPRSYGGQHFRWPEQRRLNYAKQERSSPATASEAPIESSISLDIGRGHHAVLIHAYDVLVGVKDAPFTALWKFHG